MGGCVEGEKGWDDIPSKISYMEYAIKSLLSMEA